MEPEMPAGSSRLAGRQVVLGVCGGIAAYKAVAACRRMVDAGAHVIPILTAGAERFVGHVTFSALASEPVHRSLWDDADPIPHTRIGQRADVVVVAPATARVIADYAAGRSADLLTATLLATRAPVVICPAMHTEMWEHAAVQENLTTLRRRGVTVVTPVVGRLAGGDVGAGRLAEPEEIVEFAERALTLQDLEGTRVLVTAGGTREAIDAVRVISNRSTGKQGYAVAAEAAARGAEVVLVTTVERATVPGVEVVHVENTAEMQDAVMSRADGCDVVIMAAAVSDFRPKAVAERKLKKDEGVPEILLESTHDFLVDLGARKHPRQVIVGFAAETDNVAANARDKLRRKHLDLIVANDVSAPDTGFAHDTNAVVIMSADGTEEDVPLTDKRAVARAVIDAVVRNRSTP